MREGVVLLKGTCTHGSEGRRVDKLGEGLEWVWLPL